jgi:hypothetical protein
VSLSSAARQIIDGRNYIRASPASTIHDGPSVVAVNSGCISEMKAFIISVAETIHVTARPLLA